MRKHCESCGHFLSANVYVYCSPCIEDDWAKTADENGVAKVSESKLDICKYLLANKYDFVQKDNQTS